MAEGLFNVLGNIKEEQKMGIDRRLIDNEGGGAKEKIERKKQGRWDW